MTPLYRLENLAKSYAGREVLRIPHLELAPAEVIALVGPAGAGKSTLLRLLAGLEPPTAGVVEFCGKRIGAAGLDLADQRRIAMVFQRPLMLAGSVRTNVEYGLRLRRVAGATETARRLIDALRLTDLAAQPARTLSGGQTQLVALARTLVLEPEVLLLDEPTANLDPAHVARVEQVLSEYRRRSGASLIWATHNLFQARRHADRVLLLLDGCLVEAAAAREFFDSPRDPRTTAFVRGEMIY